MLVKGIFVELPVFQRCPEGRQFWLFTLYDKDEMADLSTKERKALADMLRREVDARMK